MSVLNAQLLYGSVIARAMSLEVAVGSLPAHSLVNMDLVAAVGRQRHREKELATPLHKSDDSGELFSLIDTPLLQYCTRDLYLYSKVNFSCFLRYVLTLITDGLRSVRSFNFDKAAGSVLASSVSIIL